MSDSRDFIDFLQTELRQRKQKNASYSLRAFSKNLGVPATSLSLIMNGSRPLTPKMKDKIGSGLGLSDEELDRFYIPEVQDKKYQIVEDASFEATADWYHYAIMELIKVKDFKPDMDWIASCLGLDEEEVEDAVLALQNDGQLKIEGDQWIDTLDPESTVQFCNDAEKIAQEERTKQVLQQSLDSFDGVESHIRDHTFLTVAINKNDLDRAHEKVGRLIVELNEMLESSTDKDEVYNFVFSAFPVTKNR